MTDLGRLRWACRRGIKELDVLLTRYLDERFAAAPHSERLAFERLLATEDPLIYAYCMGQVPVPADLGPLIERLATGRAGAGGTDAGGTGAGGADAGGADAGGGPRC